jgi:IS4 transposase
MTPHQIELVKKLDQEVKNLSNLMQYTEIGDSLTLKDIRHYLYLLNKEVKEVENPMMLDIKKFMKDGKFVEREIIDYTKKCIDQFNENLKRNNP